MKTNVKFPKFVTVPDSNIKDDELVYVQEWFDKRPIAFLRDGKYLVVWIDRKIVDRKNVPRQYETIVEDLDRMRYRLVPQRLYVGVNLDAYTHSPEVSDIVLTDVMEVSDDPTKCQMLDIADVRREASRIGMSAVETFGLWHYRDVVNRDWWLMENSEGYIDGVIFKPLRALYGAQNVSFAVISYCGKFSSQSEETVFSTPPKTGRALLTKIGSLVKRVGRAIEQQVCRIVNKGE